MSVFRNLPPGLRPAALVNSRWKIFDAKDQVLGRLASQIATALMGKDKPIYAPFRDDGDVCVVINARKVHLTGNKVADKKYYWHTGYPGGIKQRTVSEEMRRDSTEVLRKAVHRMIPRNRLRNDRMRKLRIFPDEKHSLDEYPLEPFVMPPRNVREMRPRERRALERKQKPPQTAGSRRQ